MNKLLFLSFCLSFFTAAVYAQTSVSDFNAFHSHYADTGSQNVSLAQNINFNADLGAAGTGLQMVVGGNGYWLSGNKTYSGFVINSGQSLSASDLTIKDMYVLGSGGALNVNSGSAAFSQRTLFLGNYSQLNGGAINATNNSQITFNSQNGGVIFQNNVALSSGGAVYAANGTTMTFDGDAQFLNNISEGASAGALYVTNNSVVTFKGGLTVFQGNKAETEIAAVLCRYNSSIIFEGSNTRFINNSMLDNTVQGTGGLDVTDGSTADFSKTNLTAQSNSAGNHSASFGGFLWSQNSSLLFGDMLIGGGNQSEGNRATNGGGMYSEGGSAVFSGNSEFKNNVAYNSGGAIYVDGSHYDFTGAGVINFEGNYAASKGGAVYIETGSVDFQTDKGYVLFRNNKADSLANDIYLGAGANISFNTSNYGIVIEGGILSDHALGITMTKSGNNSLYLGGKNEVWGQFSILGGNIVLLSSASYSGNNLQQNAGTLDMQNNTLNTINVGDFASTHNMKIDIFSDGASDLVVSSNAAVGGNLDVRPGLGRYENKEFDIIISNLSIVSTVFASTSSGISANLSYVLNYTDNPNIVKLIVNGVYSSTFSHLSPLTDNQKEVAKTWDDLSVRVGGELLGIISDTMLVDDNEKRLRLSQASGYFLANVIRGAALDTDNNELYDKIKNHSLYEIPNSGVWAQLTGGNTRYGGDENSLDEYKDGKFGLMAGYDIYMPEHKAVLGGYAKYDNHSISEGKNSADMTNIAFGVYGGLIESKWELKSFLFGSFDSYDTSRYIPFKNATAKADFGGNTFGGDIEGAFKINIVDEYIKLRPYAGLEIKNSSYGSFEESGAGALSLDVSGGSYLRSLGRLGAGLGYDDKIWCWYVNAEAKYLLAGSTPEIESVFTGTDAKFNSKGYEEGGIIFGAGLGGSVTLTENIKLFANAQYYTADKFRNIYGNIGIRYMFRKIKIQPKETEIQLPDEDELRRQREAEENDRILEEARKRRAEPIIKSFSLNMANFDTAKSELKPKAKEDIKKAVEDIKQYQYNKITIEGHTDSVGGLEYNDILSRNRAKAVYDEFINNGIPAEKMKYIGFGSLMSIGSNETEEGRALNRRVEIFVE